MHPRIENLLVRIAMFLCVESFSTNGKSREKMENTLFIPGVSCGINSPILYLDPEKMPDKIDSLEFISCSIAKNRRDYELAMEKVEIVRCTVEDINMCQHSKRFVFLTGGQQCTKEQVKVLYEAVQEPTILECVLVHKQTALDMWRRNPDVQIDWCVDDYFKCDSVSGYVLVRNDFSCGITKKVSLIMTEADVANSDTGCALVKDGIDLPANAPNIPAIDDTLDVSHHYQYCQDNPDKTGLVLKASTGELNYTLAESFCRSNGMEVVVVRRREEYAQIRSLLEPMEEPDVLIRFFLNGEQIRFSEKELPPCTGIACGTDLVQWNDPGGLPFDATIYSSDWLEPVFGNKARSCMEAKVVNDQEAIVGERCRMEHYAVCMARCAGSPPMPAGRFQHCQDNPTEEGLVLIDKGSMTYTEAVEACKVDTMQLAVVRKQTELITIQNLIGADTPFWLAGRTPANETCSQSACGTIHIEWLDGGKTYDASLYDGSFLNLEINVDVAGTCLRLNVGTSPPTVENVICTETLKAVCMVDCTEWKTILANRT